MGTNNQIIIYQTDDDQTQIDVRLENETVWLTQAQMAELFQKDRTVISRHNIKDYVVYQVKENWTNPWYVQNLHYPRNMVVERGIYKRLKQQFITLTSSSP